jgi:hypothetical protein
VARFWAQDKEYMKTEGVGNHENHESETKKQLYPKDVHIPFSCGDVSRFNRTDSECRPRMELPKSDKHIKQRR